MSVPRKLNKSLKTHKPRFELPLAASRINNYYWTDIPVALKHHIEPQIPELLSAKWFQTARDYFTRPPEIHILSIETKEIELLNILSELQEYLATLINNPSIAPNNILSGPGASQAIQKIREILTKINPKRLTRLQRRAIRKYIEITPLGREILKAFYDQIVADGKIAPDMELIFNPYTSLVNLAEIYSQCSEYSFVRYAVPELGIQDASIHLYYPVVKRDEYLAHQLPAADNNMSNPKSWWLPDALRRICFFNRLLGTKKQPRAIHVFLADFCKEFMHVSGKADLVFTPSEINTGVCDMTDIIITRAEESLKTLLHELIHFHALDFKHAAHDEFCAGLFNITTEQSSFNLFEAHTECLASILHCLTRTISHPLYNQPLTQTQQPQHNSDKVFFSDFKRLLITQIFYTMRKAAQILATSGCSSYTEFITPTDKDKCQLRENTNVFSYFFVKTFIYLGLRDWVIGCCDPSTARFIDTDGPNGSINGQEILKQLIQDGYQNRILKKIINSEINLAQRHREQQSPNQHYKYKKSSKKQPALADNSLKMVCVV
jgi:hypothetical protein